MQKLVVAVIVLWSIGISTSVKPSDAGFTFTLIDTGGAGAGTPARQGFEAAASFWSSQLSDDINIRLNVGFQSLGGSTLGSASTALGIVTYSQFRNAIVADRTSVDDFVFAANLPSGSSFNPYINRTSENPLPYVDNDGGANNTTIRMASANAKALGFLVNPSLIDASIVFSSDFAFDYDRSNGISGGAFDFVGVAIHEIGHALGFISGVDTLDSSSGGPFSDDQFANVTPLDFTRFSADSENAGADIDWTADTRSKYFSIDGGTTVLIGNAWSTGVLLGDGRQASHWRDNFGIGIMDPTLGQGELGLFTPNDLRAFDVIGFNVVGVPEPSSLLLLAATSVGFIVARYRRSIG